MSRTVDLPDLNVWLALAYPQHSHHHEAVRYWEQQAAAQVVFCTVTALGLVRLVCQPKVMGAAVISAPAASELLEAFCRQPGVELAPTEQGEWEVFHNLMRTGELPTRLCTDAYLAALAISQGWRLVSFDRDFERFAPLDWLRLG
ncbi:MAG: TA system VapC family ribonuclease toxin [Vulcanococcus sp.]